MSNELKKITTIHNEPEKLVLIACRGDTYLYLDETQHTTVACYVTDPNKATHIEPYIPEWEELIIQPAPYYFENSVRAREHWLVGCVMKPFMITKKTEMTATLIEGVKYVDD